MATTGLARVGFTATDGQTVFSYAGLDLLDNVADSAQLAVYVDSVLKTLTTHYTVDAGAETITFVSGQERTAGEVVSIRRNTKDDARYVDYTNNSFVEESVLDLDSNQLFFLLQENIDTIGNVMSKNAAATKWEAEGLEVTNASAGSSANSLATVGQLDAAVAGVTVTTIDNASTWSFSGNASDTTFTLTSAPTGLTSAEQVFVFVSGVAQRHTTDFTLDTAGSEPVLTFVSAPPTGINNIYAVVVTGDVVSATVANGSITNDKIADGTILGEKIDLQYDSGTGGVQYARVASDGNPYSDQIEHEHIVDFDAGVRANRLNEMAGPAGNIAWNGYKITNLAVGTNSADAVRKDQMDSAISSAVSSVSGDTRVLSRSGTLTGTGTLSASGMGFTPDIVIVTTNNSGGSPVCFTFKSGQTWDGITVTITGSGFSLSGAKAGAAYSYIAFGDS